jgi:protein TonB
LAQAEIRVASETHSASLPRRRPLAEASPRGVGLALGLLLSAGAHVGLAAMLWNETPPAAEAGPVAAVELVTDAGAALAPSRRESGAEAQRGAAPPPRPAEAPPRPPSSATAPPEPAHEAPPAPPSFERAEPRLARPAPPVARDEVALPTRRIAAAPPPPPPPAVQTPARLARAVRPAPPASGARTPIIAADADDAAPGAGPGSGATPPRYGFGSAANPLPRYPEIARERGWEGVVLLSVSVSAEGRADAVRVSRSSGHEILDRAALEAVRRWRFEPGRRAGLPVAATAEVPIRFRLED